MTRTESLALATLLAAVARPRTRDEEQQVQRWLHRLLGEAR